MVIVQNHLGKITLSKQFFEQLISGTVTNCFGVVAMNACDTKQTIIDSLPFLKKRISVMYGVNVAAVVKSIQHKVRFAVEEETDFSVEKVNVFIDGLKN